MDKMPRRIGFDEAVDELSNMNDLPPGSRALIVIAGLSGSGKSHLAQAIKMELRKQRIPCLIIPQDHYYRNHDHPFLPHDSLGRPVYDLPESYHFSEFATAISQLLKGHKIEMPVFDKETLTRLPKKKIAVDPSKVIIAEGLFAIDFLKGSYLKRKAGLSRFVFVEASPDLCLARLIERNRHDFGTDAEFNRWRFNEMVLPYFEAHLLPQKIHADFIIENDWKEET